MDAAPSLETVLQALHALYHGDNVAGKEKASLWLGELQKSVFAWQISDQLLQLNRDVESCYFAAQTMRTKIQYAFHELPHSSHQSLRDSLLNHCTNVSSETPPVIVTQLSLALANLALQMSSWKNVVEELIKRFGLESKHWTFLIEFLSLLPEEIGSRSLRLGANRRNEVKQELSAASELLVQFLTTVLDSLAGDNRLCAQVLHCLGSWLTAYVIPQAHLVSSKLILLPFQALMNKDCSSQLHHSATECLCSSLIAIEDLEKNAQLAQLLSNGVLSLVELYRETAKTEDLDKSMNYCRLFTELGETFIEPLVYTPNHNFGDFKILDLLLECVGHQNYEVADVTFTFWNRLSEMLYEGNHQEIIAAYRPYAERLIVLLGRHCQYDSTMETISLEVDDFEEFRTRCSELISDIAFIVGPTNVYHEMFKTLQGDGSGTSWEVTEASLYVMAAVSKQISLNETVVVPQVVNAVLSMSENVHIAVKHTAVRLLGALREWIDKHPEYLASVLQYLLGSLQHPKLAVTAAESVQLLCSQCSEAMTSLFGQLLQIINSFQSFGLSNEVATGLLKGAAHILGKLPPEAITEGLRQLCSIQVEQLTKVLEPDITSFSSGDKHPDPTVWLDRLATVFRYTTPTVENGKTHPCQEVILQVWPVISRTFAKFGSDVCIIERCCRCIRFAVRCLGVSSTELLNPLVTQIVELYQTYPHSCCLYLGSILVDEYGGQAVCAQMLLEMLQAFCGPTFKILGEPLGFRNHPDIVDDLFRLCFRFMLRAPIIFLQSNQVWPLLNCAILCFCLDHKDANESVCKFMVEFIKCARRPEENDNSQSIHVLVTSFLQKTGQDIVNGLMKACLFCLPTFMLSDAAEILYELMCIDRPLVCKWLEVTLKALPTHTAGGAVTATQKQLYDFHKNVTSAEEQKQVAKAIREFILLYR